MKINSLSKNKMLHMFHNIYLNDNGINIFIKVTTFRQIEAKKSCLFILSVETQNYVFSASILLGLISKSFLALMMSLRLPLSFNFISKLLKYIYKRLC